MCAKIQAPTIQIHASQNPHLGLTQRLMMSAHMQQAIRLLQIPLQELEPFIEEQVVNNPLLEISLEKGKESDNHEEPTYEDNSEHEISISDKDLSILNRLDDDFREHFNQTDPTPLKRNSDDDSLKSFLEQSISVDPSLRDQLLHESHESLESEEDIKVAEILIGYIDEFGFLKTPLVEICTLHQLSMDHVQRIIKVIQTFEPSGVGASTIQESLLIQLRCLHKENSLAYQIVQDYYEELLHNRIPFIQKHLKCTYEKIQEAIESDIASLDLHPGSQFSSEPTHVIIPDVTLRLENEHLIVDVERDYAPGLRLNSRYLKMLNNPSIPNETKIFLKRHLFSARWLMRNIQQRYSTIERIAQSLAIKQYNFFTQPNGLLIPLTMKSVADELNLHESTIARTVSNKYLYSPRGLFTLRSFFTNKYTSEKGEDLSSTTVKQAILDLLTHEDRKCPLSDQKISLLLKQKGIKCARRTVAKYRSILQIANGQQRRKFHAH